MLAHRTQGAADDFLVDFGEFSDHAHPSLIVTKVCQILQGVNETVGRFKDDGGALFVGEGFEAVSPLASFAWQETFHNEAVGSES